MSTKLRLVEESDATFIFELRSNSQKSKFISEISNSLNDQENWIKQYKNREKQALEYYYIIQGQNEEALGTIRIYDIQGDSFCWGSWIVKQGAPASTAIKSALLIYEKAFYSLGFNRSHFDVRKENKSVIAFHKRMGAVIVSESDIDYFFIYTKDKFEHIKPKYKKYYNDLIK